MSKAEHSFDWTARLEAALRFAQMSGVWIVPSAETSSSSHDRISVRGDERVSGASDAIQGEIFVEHETRPARSSAQELQAVREELGDCRRCRLCESRTQIVFGVGSPDARLLFVGEAPGAEEDRRGEPFVGRAGRLLDRMIQSVGMERRQIYIANVLKCRPPNNRDPCADEVQTCLPFLWRQVDAVRPQVVCALGAHAARSLLESDAPISKLRGRPRRTRGWTVVPTFHPAFLLRNPLSKRLAWHDLKLVRRLLEQGT